MSNPTPRVTWLRNGVPLSTLPGHVLIDSGETFSTLTLLGIEKEEGGKYEAVVENVAGTARHEFRVTVKSTPSAPTSLRVTSILRDAVTLAWEAPESDGGESISGYVIERKDAVRGGWTSVGTCNAYTHSFKVGKLLEGKDYYLRVMAENSVGVGTPVETQNSIEVKNKPGIPGRPEAISVTKNSVSLSWSPPRDDGGSPITNYYVECKSSASYAWVGCNIGVKVPESRFTVTNLLEGTTYEFRVTAESVAGKSDPSMSSERVVPRELIGDLDVDERYLEQQAHLGGMVKINVNVTGDPIPMVTWYKDGVPLKDGRHIAIDNMDFMSMMSIRGATKDDSGEYEVVAKNEWGISSLSFSVNVMEAPSVPKGPLEVSEITRSSVTLSWHPPKHDGGAALSSYLIEKQQTGYREWQRVARVKSIMSSYLVTGLLENTQYNFRISAENIEGLSSPLITDIPITTKRPYGRLFYHASP
ncbi:hypothetical protein CAPTEDRAFT_139787 [Capitella teleta]|uniref:Titin n=1 Tax=Capitella teleta TaxID=283909 RepID=R7TQT4_CAPTE|nr:hypothetical protein CAPTEDRAFT_139787 [Capitella teleta]|eukprot:ELT96024.1 hypothetical protein CAPTEDRAFT_139787 [Capitella teleta]